ncbi:MAG: transposase, partial [Deltaproteobacteria bacterium]|nr:transposase [Deltaproteobacteria bacterium]
LQILGDLPVRFGVRVHAFALMPNHYHLLLTSDWGDLPRAMRHLGGEFSRRVNLLHKWDGPLFSGRYRNRVVETADYWRNLLLYVHANPVRAGLATAQRAEGTSHAIYTGYVPAPAWLDTSELRATFGDTGGYLAAWQTLVAAGMPEPPGFASKDLWRPQATGVAEAAPRQDPLGTLERGLNAVANATGMALADLVGPLGKGVRRPERWLAAWWLSRRKGVPHGQIAAALSLGHDALSRTIRRFETRLPAEPLWGAWVARLEKVSSVNT